MGGSKTLAFWGVEQYEQDLTSPQDIVAWLDCSAVIAELLWARGYRAKAQIQLLLKPSLAQLPSPFSIVDMEKAVDRVVDALANEELIAIYGDYDVDGTCGAAILVEFLTELGAQVVSYQPNRFKEGYGVNRPAVEGLIGKGARVLISVDCGVTAVDPAQACKEADVDYIVLDHHLPGEVLPDVFALVDPQLPEDSSGLHNLCGAGLAFFFIMGLRAKLRDVGFFEDNAEPNLLKFLDLVAVATIADMADVRGVNRILVSHGLKVLAKNPRPGFKALLDVAGVKDPKTTHLGFVLGPRINAAGRLETAAAALELLLLKDKARADILAAELEVVNKARREMQDVVHLAAREQALAQMNEPWLAELGARVPASVAGPWPRVLVLAGDDWHEGVLGIVASKIMDEFKRPVFVLTRKGEIYKGSARSLAKVDIFSVMQALTVAAHLTNFGGHAFAGGASMSAASLSDFRAAINEYLAMTTQEQDYRVERRFDVTLGAGELSISGLSRVMGEVDSLEPFGIGFPEPVFKVNGIAASPKILKERHLKFKLGGLDALWFGAIKPSAAGDADSGAGDEFTTRLTSEQSSYWVCPQWNEWQGAKRLQLRVTHAESSAEAASQ